ncbi:MAG: type II secretion system F family protein, partial [Candidatus Eremiobacteraeota bacterium]|nr:type II secretion system F family protein [Candidatus Eremiobacteraeota bacterium]
MIYTAVAAAMICAASLTYLVVSLVVDRRSTVRKRVSELELSVATADEGVGLLSRFLDESGRRRFEGKLARAGWYRTTPSAFLWRSIALAAGGAALGALLPIALRQFELIFFVVPVLLAVAGGVLPLAVLDRAAKQRARAVRVALPDFLDLVSTAVEGGVALNGAIAYAIDGITGPLREELINVVSDIRVGRTRAEALAAMASRLDVMELTTVVAAIIQSERIGGDIAQLLDVLSQDVRQQRMARAEEHAAKLPVKMVFPMALL